MPRPPATSTAEPRRRRAPQPPECGFSFDGAVCAERGEHLCAPRVIKVAGFFADVLVHTKGQWARQRFELADWQLDEIVGPLIGTVVWNADVKAYVRRYRICWIEIARKNGKALDVDTPILAGRGWTTLGDLRAGDTVHAPDGSLTRVQWVSDVHRRPSYRVRFADGAEIIAADDHKWLVNDRRLSCPRVVTTAEMAETLTFASRGDRRYSVDVPAPLDRPHAELPVDPYVLGAWLGDGSSYKAEVTSADPQVLAAVEAAGYTPTYAYRAGAAVTLGFRGLVRPLRLLGVLRNKHVPAAYATASADQRLALLRGLMDTDGCVVVGSNTPRVEFTSTCERLASDVLYLARSLGWKPTLRRGRAMLNGRDCGPKYRVSWTAWRDRSPFTLERKTAQLAAAPARRTRSATNAVVAVDPIGVRDVACIAVEHPSQMFLAGASLTPTHNSELLAGLVLYLLVADDEEGAEVYGAAKDRDQARKVFDVAARMVQLSPVLRARLKVYKQAKRIVDERTGSWYEIVASDAAGNLGHNPHGIAFDEVIAQRDGSLWKALRTAMGARTQPLMLAATTAGDDETSFAGIMHAEMARIADDPERARHVLVVMRNCPRDADPWDEANWYDPNPALASGFLSIDALREEAIEARNDPTLENAFRQFRLNQWVSQSSRWMPMELWQACSGNLWLGPRDGDKALARRPAFGGLDLAAKLDLVAWCLLVPDDPAVADGPVHALWRFWIPEAGLDRLDALHDRRLTAWARSGWLTVTEGSVIDYDRVVADIAADAATFAIAGVDADEWSMWPVINRVADACGLDPDGGAVTAYKNTYDRMSPGMDDVMAMVRTGRLRHHGNPVAAWCFDAVEVRRAAYDRNLLRPVKPDRGADRHRIDAVPTAAMAANAMRARLTAVPRRSAYEDGSLLVV